MDAGADFSVIPRYQNDLTLARSEALRAAKDTGIRMYGHRFLILSLGLNRTSLWVLMVTIDPYRIVSINFLQHFSLLLKAQCRKIEEHQRSANVTSSYPAVSQITPQYAEPPAQQPYSELLRDYPNML